jgi:release factor glutamine methyltransferase
MSETWTIGRLIPWAAQYLAARQVASPRLSAELMLAEVLACSRVDLYLRFEQPLSPEELAAFKALLLRRRSGEPLAYILGRREFYGLSLAVTPATLIPRPETEHLVEEGLRLLSQRPSDAPPPRVLDLCTGSGAVALALAQERPDASVTATDLAREALAVAQANAQALGLASRVTFLAGSLWEPLAAAGGFFDLITANPPYVTEDEWAGLSPEVKDFEPRSALVAGPQGLELAGQIIVGARAHLRPLGWLLLELGASQAIEAKAVARAANVYDDIHTVRDLAGIERVLACRRKDGG